MSEALIKVSMEVLIQTLKAEAQQSCFIKPVIKSKAAFIMSLWMSCVGKA
jgi:hypothetical protein